MALVFFGTDRVFRSWSRRCVDSIQVLASLRCFGDNAQDAFRSAATCGKELSVCRLAHRFENLFGADVYGRLFSSRRDEHDDAVFMENAVVLLGEQESIDSNNCRGTSPWKWKSGRICQQQMCRYARRMSDHLKRQVQGNDLIEVS